MKQITFLVNRAAPFISPNGKVLKTISLTQKLIKERVAYLSLVDLELKGIYRKASRSQILFTTHNGYLVKLNNFSTYQTKILLPDSIALKVRNFYNTKSSNPFTDFYKSELNFQDLLKIITEYYRSKQIAKYIINNLNALRKGLASIILNSQNINDLEALIDTIRTCSYPWYQYAITEPNEGFVEDFVLLCNWSAYIDLDEEFIKELNLNQDADNEQKWGAIFNKII